MNEPEDYSYYRITGDYVEYWGRQTFTDIGSNSYSGVSGWYYSDQLYFNVPISIYNPVTTITTSGPRGYVANVSTSSSNKTIEFRIFIMNSISSSYNVVVHMFGRTTEKAGTSSVDGPDDQTEAGPVEEIEP